MICAGIDAGSRTIKVVLADAGSLDVLAAGLDDQGVRQDALAGELLERLLEQAGLDRGEPGFTVGTGYARNILSAADTTITEITCHARGVHHLLPDVRTVIDIGGQDSKLIRMNPDGSVRDFAMNDRCAAGTGRFLELLAAQLELPMGSLGEMASRGASAAPISSMCAVFAETEIIGLLAAGGSPEEIVAGVQASIASRIAAMVGRRVTPPVVFTGGVALVGGMDSALSGAIGHAVQVAPDPQMTGALGAAIMAAERCPRAPGT